MIINSKKDRKVCKKFRPFEIYCQRQVICVGSFWKLLLTVILIYYNFLDKTVPVLLIMDSISPSLPLF